MTCKNIYPELQAWIDRNAAFRRQEQAIAARIAQRAWLGLNEFYFLYYLSKCPERRMRVPIKNGNTSALVKAFMEGAESAEAKELGRTL